MFAMRLPVYFLLAPLRRAVAALVLLTSLTGAALAAAPTAEQYRLAAALPGASVSWSHDRGVPLAVRGPDVGAVNLGGRGVAPGGSFETRAVAVLDRLAGLYRIQDAQAEFAVLHTASDATGWHHVRIEQRYRNLPVVGSGLIVHFNPEGLPSLVNGRYIPGIDLETQVVLSADDAVRRASELIRAARGAGGELRSALAPVLVVYARQGAPVMAYELALAGEGVMARWRCWVDAVKGGLLESLCDVRTASVKEAALITGKMLPGEGGAEGTVSGSQTGAMYQLLSDSGYLWRVWNADTSGAYPDSGAIAWRTNNNWGVSDTEEFSAAYNFWRVLDYYSSAHGRLGYDGRGVMARINVHHPDASLANNAAWDPGTKEFYFGLPDGLTASGMEVLDISAHEFAHAVDSYTAGLTYSYESGALSESFADILGALAEFSIQPDGRGVYPQYTAGCADWLIGEDCTLGGSWGMRDMRNPASPLTSSGSQPTKYRGTHWVSGSADNGGVHANSGVQNFFFYLLVEGGSGNNDGLVYNITGLGLEAGQTLAYKVLASYATANMDHYDAREAWIGAAQESAVQHPDWPLIVAASWSAVGVNPDTRPSMAVVADFDGDRRADPALYEPGSGLWTFMLSSLGYAHVEQSFVGSVWDSYNKTAAAADFDGDQRADPAVYQDYWTIWSVWVSGYGYSVVEGEWGGGGCFGAAGDVDGDRRGDFCFYSYGLGAWHFCLSSGNYDTHAYLNFGAVGRYTPLAADFDGDGRDDPALYDAYTGAWAVLLSGGNYQQMIPVNGLGGGGDPGAAGDVDGDGLADLAVYHTGTGLWDFMLSSMNYQVLTNVAL